ncbi:MAG: hypothetical protein Q9181_004513 [Wetmoreana brouardii]
MAYTAAVVEEHHPGQQCHTSYYRTQPATYWIIEGAQELYPLESQFREKSFLESFDGAILAYLHGGPTAMKSDQHDKPSDCLLRISSFSPGTDSTQVPSAARVSTYFLLLGREVGHYDALLDLPHLDEILDGSTQTMEAADKATPSVEHENLDNFQEFRMAKFTTYATMLLSHIEWLGRGVEMKSYYAERRSNSPESLAVQVSTVGTGLASKPAISKVKVVISLIRRSQQRSIILRYYSWLETMRRQRTPAGLYAPSGPERPSPTVPKQSPTGVLEVSTSLFSESLDPIFERALLEAKILDLHALIEEQSRVAKYEEQKLHSLQEELETHQLKLGSAQPPAHLNIRNVFDDQASPDSPAERDLGSPGATTLVECGPDNAPQFPGRDSLSEKPLLDMTDVHLYHRNEDKDTISVVDPMPDIVYQASNKESPEVKKRKRLSTQITAKKARTGDKVQGNDACHDHAAHGENQPSICPSRQQESNTDHVAVRQVQVDDGDNPTKTSRPTSWPPRRLFRRSAGVSVKKLTDVFERLRLPQDKHSAPMK